MSFDGLGIEQLKEDFEAVGAVAAPADAERGRAEFRVFVRERGDAVVVSNLEGGIRGLLEMSGQSKGKCDGSRIRR